MSTCHISIFYRPSRSYNCNLYFNFDIRVVCDKDVTVSFEPKFIPGTIKNAATITMDRESAQKLGLALLKAGMKDGDSKIEMRDPHYPIH